MQGPQPAFEISIGERRSGISSELLELSADRLNPFGPRLNGGYGRANPSWR
jgi:hypothetical protein